MSKIEKVLIIMIATIVIAFSLIYSDEVNQHKKEIITLNSQWDSLKNMTWRSIGQTKMALDSFEKYKKLYLISKTTQQLK